MTTSKTSTRQETSHSKAVDWTWVAIIALAIGIALASAGVLYVQFTDRGIGGKHGNAIAISLVVLVNVADILMVLRYWAVRSQPLG